MHCNTLQRIALQHFNALQHTTTHCNTMQHNATHRNAPQHTAIHCNTLQHKLQHKQQTATRSRASHDIVTHRNTLQHTAIHCNTQQYTATQTTTQTANSNPKSREPQAANRCLAAPPMCRARLDNFDVTHMWDMTHMYETWLMRNESMSCCTADVSCSPRHFRHDSFIRVRHELWVFMCVRHDSFIWVRHDSWAFMCVKFALA